jgi:hypothetical protein
MSTLRYGALAAQWERFADAIASDWESLPEGQKVAARARHEVWTLAAELLRCAQSGDEPNRCAQCGRGYFPIETLARQADAIRAAVEGALAVAFERPGDALTDASGGSDMCRAALTALQHAATLALKHAQSLACVAGTCRRAEAP